MTNSGATPFNCEDCGQSVSRIRRAGDPMICVECGIRRTIVSSHQLAAKSGPYYEKWLASKGVAGRPRRHPSGE